MHSSKAGAVGRLVANSRKSRILYNPHGFSFLMRNASKRQRTFYWTIEKICAMKKCTIIGCSKGEYEEALKLNKNAICISNGINIKEIYNYTVDMKNTDTSNKLKICTIGRISYQKNPELFNKIAENFPECEFTWIGEGDLKEKLTSPNITVTGWLDRKEALSRLNNADIFILPSLWEGMSIALLEAMYFKKICIVSDIIGNRDAIENEVNGFVAKDDDDYINIINNIIHNKYNLDEIRENAYKSIAEEFNTDKLIEQYKTLYANGKIEEKVLENV